MKFAGKPLIRTAVLAVTLLAANAHDAWSQLLTKVETFTAIAGTGPQTISTTGFQPKAVLFWITDRTSVGNGAFARFGRGWTDGTRMGAVSTAWDDGSAANLNDSRTRLVTTACITLIDETATVLAEATITSFNADGFTINWGIDGGSRLVAYLALGGANLTNAYVGGFNFPAGPLGTNHSETAPGFQPDAVLFIGTDFTQSLNTTNDRGGDGFGIALSPTDRHSDAHRWRDLRTGTDSGSSGIDTNYALIFADDANLPDNALDLVSMDPNGFTVTNDLGISEPGVSYLALKGMAVGRGLLTQPSSTGNQSVSGLSFQPSVVLFDGGDKANVEPNFVQDAEMVFGVATSSTERAAVWIGSGSNNSPYPSDTDLSTSAVIRSLTAGTPSVDAAADFVSMDSNGFTINWSSVDATARRVGWIALGSPASDVFYSVGTDGANLMDGAPSITITNGTAVLTVPQTRDIGVGDEIDYGGGSIKAYIKSIINPSQFVVHAPAGGVPPDVSGLMVNSIKRAFNDLVTAETNSSDIDHLNNPSLIAADANLTWVCYNDGPLTVAMSTTITISGYTTDATHTLTLTAASASQVVSGNSQRHTGTAGTGAQLLATGNDGPMLSITDGNVTVEWLELDGSQGSVFRRYGVFVDSSTGNIVVRDLIVHDFEHATGANGIGIKQADPVYVYNNIVYGIQSFSDTAFGIIDENDGNTAEVHVYNNTVFNVQQTDSGSTAKAYGIAVPDLTNWNVQNNIVIGTTSSGTGTKQDYCVYSGTLGTNEVCHTSGTPPSTASLDHNMSSDDTAVGTGSIINEDSGEFKSAVLGTEDLHLESDADAVGAGFDLGGTVDHDIDDQLRPLGDWEMGADEVSTSWFGGGWGLRRQITIDNTGREELLEFPMLICLDASTIDYSRVQDGGEDLRFLDKDNATVLPHEIEEWNESGTSYVWVNVPQIDADATDFIHMYYDNATAGDGQDPINVWRNNFESVYHLHANFADSSGTNGAGTNSGSINGTASKLAGDHQTFDGIDDYIDLNWTPSYAASQDFTWEGWLRVNLIEATNAIMAIEDRFGCSGCTLGDNSELRLGVRETQDPPGTPFPVDMLNNLIRSDAAPIYQDFFSTSLTVDWHYLTLVRDGSTGRTYLDGIEVNNAAVSTNAIDFPTGWSGPTNTLLIGAQWDTDTDPTGQVANELAGDIDEVRTSMVARSADWIDAQYASTSCNLVTFGGEVQATAVELVDFQAQAGDGAVELRWETGSEVDNVGFYLYRAEAAGGPFELVNETVIPGLGSSPLGASYRYVDTGLVNGTTYFYELEDLESTGVKQRHGPVSATPQVGASFEAPEGEGDEEDSYDPRITYGDPEATSIQILQLSKREVLIELFTEGFYATPQEDGSVRLEIPGFLDEGEPGTPAVPIKQAWVQAMAGKQVRIKSIQANEVAAFTLRPSAADILEPVMTPRGAVRLARRAANPGRAFRSKGLYPEKAARLVSVAFQQELKKALLELAPLRWDSSTGQLLLARHLVVRLRFEGKATGELSLGGSRGRKHRAHKEAGKVVAQLVTSQRGLYGVPFEDVFGVGRRSLKTGELRLSYQGEPVAYYVLPNAKRFGKGSLLYFVSQGESLNPYGREVVFELAVGGEDEKMRVVKAEPAGPSVSHYDKTLHLEENHLFQGRLTTAPDIWLWDQLLAPVLKSYPFEVTDLAAAPEMARLKLWIQGTTDLAVEPDHHVRVYVNGTLLEDFTLEGELPWEGESELLPGILHEGENLLEIENVGDTGAAYSRVMLSRFEVSYPRQLVVESGWLEGTFASAGVAEVSGLSGSAFVVDTTITPTRWLKQLESAGDTVRFQVEEGHRYLVADSSGVLAP